MKYFIGIVVGVLAMLCLKIGLENPIHQMDDLDYGIGLYHDSITIVDEYGLDTTVHYTEDLSELFLNLNL